MNGVKANLGIRMKERARAGKPPLLQSAHSRPVQVVPLATTAGYHRKRAVRILGGAVAAAGAEEAAPVRRPCRYDAAVREALVVEVADSDSGRVDGAPWPSPP